MIAATPAGLTFLDSGGSRSLYAFHGLVNNHVYALANSGNRVLAGTLGGLSVLESGIVRASFTTANSTLGHNWITAIVPVDDEFFVGTYGAGVVRADASGRFARFPDFQPNVEINPGALAATANAVYAGTLNRGLAVYSLASGRWTFIKEGLPSLSVTALAFDRGVLYVGTDNGIVRATEERLGLR
jgi:ligand-binding sensor domain-containing protein